MRPLGTKLPRLALLLALLALFAGLKAMHQIHWAQGRDGRFYTDVARHVMDGEGLATRISNYNQGFQTFPHRTNQTPLWPLVYGLSARVVGLETAAKRIPQLLYLVDLLLLYFLANRVWLRISGRPARGIAGTGAPDLGHAAVFLFGANAIFFRFTSQPFTEALAFGLAFGALLCLDEAAVRRSAAWAVGAGALATLTMLTRGQLLAVPVAIVGGLAVAGWRRPRGWLLPVAGAGACVAVLVPWALYLATWVDQLTLPIILGFGQQNRAIGLPHFDFFVKTHGLADYLADRWGGVVTAFDPGDDESYFASFGWPVALVPVAAVLGAVAYLRGAGRTGRWIDPEKALVWTVVAVAVGSLLPVHHAHGVIFRPWLFSYRHGLPFLFALVPAFAYLLSRPQLAVRLGSLAVLAVGCVQAAVAVSGELPGNSSNPVRPSERQLGRWLDSHDHTPIVLFSDPSRLALVSKAYFHWTICDEPPENTERLIKEAGVEYVVRRGNEKHCPFTRVDGLVPLKSFRKGADLLVLATPNAHPPAEDVARGPVRSRKFRRALDDLPEDAEAPVEDEP